MGIKIKIKLECEKCHAIEKLKSEVEKLVDADLEVVREVVGAGWYLADPRGRRRLLCQDCHRGLVEGLKADWPVGRSAEAVAAASR
jgi:hypothetical protein